MRQLLCEKCEKPATNVEESCGGIELQLCDKHAEEYTINEELPSRIKTLQRQIRDTKKAIKCQNSPNGHDYVDITNQTFVMGSYVYRCSKCGHDKLEPFDFNLSNISFTDSEERK